MWTVLVLYLDLLIVKNLLILVSLSLCHSNTGSITIVLLFLLNLTVDDGTISAFVLYVSINSATFFLYTAVSKVSYNLILIWGLKYAFMMVWMIMLKCG